MFYCEDLMVKLTNFQEHTYAGSPGKFKRKCLEMTAKAEQINREAQNAVRREKRAKKTCSSLLADLEKLNYINAELKARLDSYGGM